LHAGADELLSCRQPSSISWCSHGCTTPCCLLVQRSVGGCPGSSSRLMRGCRWGTEEDWLQAGMQLLCCSSASWYWSAPGIKLSLQLVIWMYLPLPCWYRPLSCAGGCCVPMLIWPPAARPICNWRHAKLTQGDTSSSQHDCEWTLIQEVLPLLPCVQAPVLLSSTALYCSRACWPKESRVYIIYTGS
jgi:hypothetical protein